jgi:Ca-activated chloride channel family protein
MFRIRLLPLLLLFPAAAMAAGNAEVRSSDGAVSRSMTAALAHPVVLAGDKTTTYLRVAVTGSELEDPGARTPVNLALVLDKSGSMQGDKIRRAKEAARQALRRLTGQDIASVVAYDDTVDVLVPATRMTDKSAALAAIERLEAGGSTALFAGVSKGAAEVMKFRDIERVNRVVLMSDGLANVGPDSPGALAELGSSLSRDGLTVSTIGLGLDYNEDLMTQLALKSDGNHYFAENATDLTRVFETELGAVLAVVAQDVTIRIDCAAGVRPVRALGREADISGNRVTAKLNQLYSGQTKYVLIEVELPRGEAGARLPVATTRVKYVDMAKDREAHLESTVAVRYTDDPAEVEASIDDEVMAAAVHQIAVENNIMAMRLRDQGQVAEAREALLSNSAFLSENALRLDSDSLREYAGANREAAEKLDSADWTRARKGMREEQYQIMQQQVAE